MALRAAKSMSVKWVLRLLILPFFPYFLYAQYGSYPTANLSTLRRIDNSKTSGFTDGSVVQPILTINKMSDLPAMACGFFGNGSGDSFYFITFAIGANSDSSFTRGHTPRVLWSANRDNPLKENATLQLNSHGDLVLRDVDDALVWSTNTSGKSVVGMNITETGNLVLFDINNTIIWQSFDHPTDTWLPGQKLRAGQRLIASVSNSNWTRGLIYLSVTENGLYAYIESSPPQMYRKVFRGKHKSVSFKSGKFDILQGEASDPISVLFVSEINSFQYLKLDSDGHLRVYQTYQGLESVADDILTGILGRCGYPTVCGNYGICSDQQCGCPIGIDGDQSYFRPINDRQPNFGCIETTQLSCKYPDLHYLQELPNVSYFSFVPVLSNIDVQSCKAACFKNCSCKAALFRYESNLTNGNCSFLSQLFSLMNNQVSVSGYNISTFIKVQRPFVTPSAPSASSAPSAPSASTAPSAPSAPSGKRTVHIARIVGPIIGIVILTSLIFSIYVAVCRKGTDDEEGIIESEGEEEEMNSLYQVSGFPMRFSFEDLKSATRNFQIVLGRGGFGSVFEGNLDNGNKVAVKRLDHLGQGKKEFLAEVKTIGKIHHINLVRLVGFCVEKSQRHLVYEYMCNGSLDKWIFTKNQESLDWETRQKIIIGIAKGLEYLHEYCKQKIVHRDIKPQNILLDDNFNAKVSDFGLARFIDRDQSQVETKMKGTLGYLAPEWRLGRGITEKVDVYAFGVVILEIICGRKNLDYSQPEENDCLQHIVQEKAENDQLFDVVDQNCQEMQQH